MQQQQPFQLPQHRIQPNTVPILWRFFFLAWTSLLIATTTTTVQAHGAFGRRGGGVAAAIFGIGNNNNNKVDEKPMLPPPPPRPLQQTPFPPPSTETNLRHGLPPPPPPPPPPLARGNHLNQTQPQVVVSPPPLRNKHQQQRPPPPPTWAQGGSPDMMQQQHQQQQPFWNDNTNMFLPPSEALFYDLDQALQREAHLVQQVQNLSSTICLLEQREDLHNRQMDVLTERITQDQAAAAKTTTTLVEVQANCTALYKEMAILQGQLKEYEARCSEFATQKESLEADKKDLNKQLKVAQRQAENLATQIEVHRLHEEKEHKSTKKKQKRRGFFAWLFGIYPDEEEEEEDWEGLKEMARSTLLQALQNERNNVEELENAVAALQTNNSAIADQVESRDAIIDELNDRIAVFEDDKVVLKAALKQLQKEIKEEAPKTARLLSDLKAAQKEISRVEKSMEKLRQEHAQETAKLNQIIVNKNQMLNQSKANLTMIGTYVDKLEERLADFAVARRDINVRSKKLDDLEGEIQALQNEKLKLQEQMSAYEEEHAQIKTLMEEMTRERTKLLGQNRQLSTNWNTSQVEIQRLHTSLQSIETELETTRNATTYWERAANDLQYQLQSQAREYEQFTKQQSAIDDASSDLLLRVDEMEKQQSEWQNRLAQAESVRDDLVRKLELSVTSQVAAEEQAATLQRNLTAIEQQKQEDANRLAAAIEARDRIEESFRVSKQQEETLRKDVKETLEALQKEAKAREEALEQKLLETKEALRRASQQNVSRVATVPTKSVSSDKDGDAEQVKPVDDGESETETETEDEKSVTETEEETDVETESEDRGVEQGKLGKEEQEIDSQTRDTAKQSNEISPPDILSTNATAIDGSKLNATSANLTETTNATGSKAAVKVGNQTRRGPPPRLPPPVKRKKAVFRPVRKFFAHTTGLHGFFSNKDQVPRRMPIPPRNATHNTTLKNATMESRSRSPASIPGGVTMNQKRPDEVPPRLTQQRAGVPPSRLPTRNYPPRQPPPGVPPQNLQQRPPLQPDQRTPPGRTSPVQQRQGFAYPPGSVPPQGQGPPPVQRQGPPPQGPSHGRDGRLGGPRRPPPQRYPPARSNQASPPKRTFGGAAPKQ